MAKDFELFEYDALKKNKLLNAQKRQLKTELELEAERNTSEIFFLFINSLLKNIEGPEREKLINIGMLDISKKVETKLKTQQEKITSNDISATERFEALKYLTYLENQHSNALKIFTDSFDATSKRLKDENTPYRRPSITEFMNARNSVIESVSASRDRFEQKTESLPDDEDNDNPA